VSTVELKPGDRVRLRVDCPEQGYRAGAGGAIWSGPHPTPGGGRHYYVTMDRAGEANGRTDLARPDRPQRRLNP
jgi:hypothetical protein